MDTSNERLQRALLQRNWAFGCAILTFALSIALILETFVRRHRNEEMAQQTVVELQKDLRANQDALRATQSALEQSVAAQRAAQAKAAGH